MSVPMLFARLDEAACWQPKEDGRDDGRENPVDRGVHTGRWLLNHLCDHEAHHRFLVQLLRSLSRQGPR